jgi:hypothetical protein
MQRFVRHKGGKKSLAFFDEQSAHPSLNGSNTDRSGGTNA